MTAFVDIDRLRELAETDRELRYTFRGYSGLIRLQISDQTIDLTISDGGIAVAEGPIDASPDVLISGPDAMWEMVFRNGTPDPGYESLTMASTRGVSVEGDFLRTIAPYQSGLQRIYQVLRSAVVGPAPKRPATNPFKATDDAVGRYRYVTSGGVESRVYFEQAGTGPVPLLLHHTAGADGRQYRHLLADPAMQERFTMYAYDLPYHGKSLPPEGVRWWEEPYLPSQTFLMDWVVAIADALALDQPYFMGCSVGGQLALDLAAEHGDRFGAFISLNGWYDVPEQPLSFTNDIYRTPAISSELYTGLMYGATSPVAPEEFARETYWIYRSNFPGIYAGDNDYFMTGHDMKINGHKVDAISKPVYVITGEYDASTAVPDHGGAAVEAKIPGAVHRVAPGLGHFGPSDDPAAFSAFAIPVFDEILSRTRASAVIA